VVGEVSSAVPELAEPGIDICLDLESDYDDGSGFPWLWLWLVFPTG